MGINMDYTYEQLKLAAICNNSLNSIRDSAIGSIIFGILAILLGLNEFNHPDNIVIKFFGGLLFLLGVFLATEGLIALLKPSPGTYRLQAIGFILVGSWNILIGIMGFMEGSCSGIFFGFLGIYQVVFGVKSFKRAREFEKAIIKLSDKSIIEVAEELRKELPNANPKNNENYIEFTASALVNTLQWKGKITDDYLVLFSRPGDFLKILSREDINIDKKGKVLIGKALKIEVNIKSTGELSDNTKRDGLVTDLSDSKQPAPGKVEKYKGTINPEYYQRFENWKKSTPITGDLPKKNKGHKYIGDEVYNLPDDL